MNNLNAEFQDSNTVYTVNSIENDSYFSHYLGFQYDERIRNFILVTIFVHHIIQSIRHYRKTTFRRNPTVYFQCNFTRKELSLLEYKIYIVSIKFIFRWQLCKLRGVKVFCGYITLVHLDDERDVDYSHPYTIIYLSFLTFDYVNIFV